MKSRKRKHLKHRKRSKKYRKAGSRSDELLRNKSVSKIQSVFRKKQSKKDELCAICLEKLGKRYYKTKCNHKFHHDCLKIWTDTKDTCPYCRKVIDKLPDTDINLIDEVKNNNISNVVYAFDNAENIDILDISDNIGYTPLHIAVKNGNVGMVKLLLRRGINISQRIEDKTRHGETTLHLATNEGNRWIVNELLERGAIVNATTPILETPLHYAAKSSNDRYYIIKLLIEAGAIGNCRDKDNWTPLHWATANGQSIKTIEFLIKSGANVNEKASDDGRTALHLAVQENRNEIVKTLLKNGGNVNIKNNDGEKPVDIARSPEIKRIFNEWDMEKSVRSSKISSKRSSSSKKKSSK